MIMVCCWDSGCYQKPVTESLCTSDREAIREFPLISLIMHLLKRWLHGYRIMHESYCANHDTSFHNLFRPTRTILTN